MLCAFLGAVSVNAYCAIEIVQIVKSSQQPRITTDQFARPLSGVRIEVYRGFGASCSQPKGNAQLVLVADAQGSAVLPKLPQGKYYLLAQAQPNLRANLCLNISSHVTATSREFTLNLAPCDPDPTYEQIIAGTESAPDFQTVPEFRGEVLDPTGAPIRRATIEVVFKGTGGKKYAANLQTDALGRFFANLPEGGYVAFFRGQGFENRVVGLTISKAEGHGEIQIKLWPGPTT